MCNSKITNKNAELKRRQVDPPKDMHLQCELKEEAECYLRDFSWGHVRQAIQTVHRAVRGHKGPQKRQER